MRYFDKFDCLNVGETIEGYFYPGMQMLIDFRDYTITDQSLVKAEMTYGITYRFVSTCFGIHDVLLIEFTDPNREGEFFFTIKE